MAYVAPDSTIELYQLLNAPLSPSYEHTLWFENVTAQRAYFEAHRYSRYEKQSYTRVSSNKIRILAYAESMRYCNYMGFNNRNDNRWYYAFIINQEYINENVTEITFVIDEIQTWFLNTAWNECFIERQHSLTDTAGDNLQPEDLHPENYVVTDELVSFDSSGTGVGYILAVGTFTLEKASHTLFTQNQYGGYASTIKYLYFRTPSELISFINTADIVEGGFRSLFASGDLWDCIGLYVVPVPAVGETNRFFNVEGVPITITGKPQVFQLMANSNTFDLTPSGIGAPTKLGYGVGTHMYVPKNKKLLTYPYTYLSVDTPTQTVNYKYELFDFRDRSDPTDKPIRFFYSSSCNPEPYIIVYPNLYSNDYNNYKYSLVIDDFPKLATYQSGMMNAVGASIGNKVKNGIAVASNMIIDYISQLPIKSASTDLIPQPTPMGVVKNDYGTKNGINYDSIYADVNRGLPALHEVSKLSSSGGISSLTPVLVPKTQGDVPTQFVPSNFSIKIQQWGIIKETAQKFDNDLSKYGYAQNVVGRPRIHARKNWTYIKTRDCSVSGPMPQIAIETINHAMNNGITWWASTSTAGRYIDPDLPLGEREFVNPLLV